MTLSLRSILCARALLALALCAVTTAAGEPWKQYANPADVGWSAEKLDECRRQAEQNGAAAVFVVVRGHVLAAWGPVERRFECHSVRKSLVSALLGNHVASGAIDIEKTLADLNIDDVPPLTPDERTARVEDLLTSRSGIYHPAAKEPADMRAERPARGTHAPGRHFWYNNWGFNALGTIFEKQTGRRLFEAFRDEMAQPLGMEDFRLEDGLAELEPSSSIHPAHAFKLSARDLARVGWCLLENGRWDGRQRIAAQWIAESTRIHSATRDGGYGYMWWVYPAGSFGESSKLDALNACDKFAASGTGGQVLLVVPALQVVFVHRGDTANKRPVSGAKVWALAEQILDARIPSPSSSPAAEAVAPRLVALKPQPLDGVRPAPPEPPVLPHDAARLAALVGEFEREGDEPRQRVRFHVFEGRFFAHAPGLGETELFAGGGDKFFSRATNLQIAFESEADGTVRRASASVEGQSWRLLRVAP